MVSPSGELRDASIPAYRYKGLSIDETTFVDPQATIYLRSGSADADRSAASMAQKRALRSPSPSISSDECSYKLTTLAVKNVGPLVLDFSTT